MQLAAKQKQIFRSPRFIYIFVMTMLSVMCIIHSVLWISAQIS